MSSYDYYVRPVQDISLAHRCEEHFRNKDIHFTIDQIKEKLGLKDLNIDLSSYVKRAELSDFLTPGKLSQYFSFTPSSTVNSASSKYAIGTLNVNGVAITIYAKDVVGSGSGSSTTPSTGDKVSYTGFVTATAAGAYQLGKITINNLDTIIYGKDTVSSGTGTGGSMSYVTGGSYSSTNKILTLDQYNASSVAIDLSDIATSSGSTTTQATSYVTTASNYNSANKNITLYLTGNGPTVTINMSGLVNDPQFTKDTLSYNVAAFIATAPSVYSLNTPSGGSYDFITKYIQYPQYWYASPELAKRATGLSTVWVSYNNFLSDGTLTGWTKPVKYIDIDGIIDAAHSEAEAYYKQQLENANSELNTVLGTAKDKLVDANTQLQQAKNLLLTIESTGGDYSGLATKVSAIEGQISANGWSVDRKLSGTFRNDGTPSYSQQLNNISLINPDMYTGSGFSRYALPVNIGSNRWILRVCDASGVLDSSMTNGLSYNSTNGWYYDTSETTTMICSNPTILDTGVIYSSALYNALNGKFVLNSTNANVTSNDLEETIVDASYKKIRTELTSTNYATNSVTLAVHNIAANEVSTQVSQLFGENVNTSLLRMTPAQIVLSAMGGSTSNGTTVDENTVKSAIMDIVKDRITLSVADGSTGNGASITLQVKNGNGQAVIDAGTVTITGDMIAKAIESSQLSINSGKAVIYGDGSAHFGKGTTQFNIDGSGYTAGGNIRWDAQGNNNLIVTGVHRDVVTRINSSNKNQYIDDSGVLDVSKCGNLIIFEDDPQDTVILPHLICGAGPDGSWDLVSGGLTLDQLRSLSNKEITIVKEFIGTLNIEGAELVNSSGHANNDYDTFTVSAGYGWQHITALRYSDKGPFASYKYLLRPCHLDGYSGAGLSIFPQYQGAIDGDAQEYDGPWE